MIDTSAWKSFKIGDLFDKLELKCLKDDFSKALDCSEEQTTEFSLPLTNAKHFNNGIQFYGRPVDWDSAEMTIDIVSNGAIATGDVYAQPQRTGVLWDSYLVKCKYNITSEYVLQYMACVLQRCIKQFFGWDDKCTWERVKEHFIKLPVKPDGLPDWDYMDSYMKQIMEESKERLEKLKRIDDSKQIIDVYGWKSFLISDLFTVLKGSRLTKKDKIDGSINFVSTSISNNGVINKIGNSEHIHPGNTMVVVYDGHATGRAYYQDEPYWASDSVNVLYPKFRLNKYIGLYLVPIFEKVGEKFVYTDKWNQEKMIKTEIYLPITSTGEPDWQYMEDYMKHILVDAEQVVDDLRTGA